MISACQHVQLDKQQWLKVHDATVCTHMSLISHACARAQAAEQAAATGRKLGTGKVHEAAVFAALAGHLPLMQGACGGWQDACWAASRAWLEHAVDSGELLQHPRTHSVYGVLGLVLVSSRNLGGWRLRRGTCFAF